MGHRTLLGVVFVLAIVPVLLLLLVFLLPATFYLFYLFKLTGISQQFSGQATIWVAYTMTSYTVICHRVFLGSSCDRGMSL